MKKNKSIYLCGPITGASSRHIEDWREYVKSQLEPQIECLSPTRDSYDAKVQYENPDNRYKRILNGKRVVARDRMDVMNCDVVLVNFENSERVSIGSVGELFWADAYRKPIVAVLPEGNIHHHDMIIDICSYFETSIDMAIARISVLLNLKIGD